MEFSIGILGASHPHCAGRISQVSQIPSARIAGVYDADAEAASAAAAAAHAARRSSAEEVLCDDQLDLILIEGRNDECSEYAIRAAQMGRPMLLEKPGGETAARVAEAARAVERAGSFCQVGYHLRYSPSIAQGVEIVRRGQIGRITTCRFHAAVMQPWLTSEWFCDPHDRGGMVHNDFCHMLDLLTLFLGDLSSHNARIVKLAGVPEHPFEDSAAFVLSFGDVLAAGDCCGWEANDWISTWDIELYGTEGTLKLGIHPPWVRVYRPDSGWEETRDETFDGEMNYRYEIEDAIAGVRQGRLNRGCGIAHALKVAQWIDEMYLDNGV